MKTNYSYFIADNMAKYPGRARHETRPMCIQSCPAAGQVKALAPEHQELHHAWILFVAVGT